MSSEKLYYNEVYSKEFDAEVIDSSGNEIVLNKTLFYPTGGGQIHDTGEINGIKVISVEERNGKIYHTLEKNDFKAGDEIHGKIDWDRRYKLMRLHSAVHITYFMFTKIYGEHQVVGSNISPEKGRIDFKIDTNINEKLTDIEKLVNKYISDSHEITTYLDKKSEELRTWESDGNKMPCGGTHLKNSAEISRVRLKRKNIGKGEERIEVTLAG